MKGLIFNASPLILLGKIDLLDAIPAITPRFVIPQEVVLEIGAGPATDPTIQWLRAESRTKHIVESPLPPANLLQWDLGVGETAVLALALKEGKGTVVLDDLAARKFALTYDIPLIGTLGFLIRAKKQGIIKELSVYLPLLLSAGASLSEEVLAEALKLAGEN